jgi:hypothetical protein
MPPLSAVVCDAATGLRGGEPVDARAVRPQLAGDLEGGVHYALEQFCWTPVVCGRSVIGCSVALGS